MRVGDLLFDGRYRIIEQIAQSKMSSVYLAQNLALGNYWVIKEAKKNTQYNFDLLAEPNILKRLSHPALPRIVDIHEDRECVYIVEDYIRGRSLDKILQEKGKIDEAVVIDLAKQICNVLIYLHKQSPYPIIYRDMKPSNIMLTEENEIKLIDFGIAREYKSENYNDTTYMGSKGYAAPEQYGKSQSDVRTDIYSFGVTMYHLLTGNSPLEPPYEVRKLRTISRRFSEGMEYIVDRCTQNDPDDRYQNVYEVLYDLENIYEFNSMYRDHKNKEKIKNIVKVCMLAISFIAIIGGLKLMDIEKNERYDDLVDKGFNELKVYNFDSAMNYFEDANELIKRRIDSYLGIGQTYLNQGDYEICINYLDDIEAKVKKANENPQFHYLRGTAYYEIKNYEKAIMDFHKATEYDVDKVEYQRDLAVCYAKTDRIEKAKDVMDEIILFKEYDDVVYYVNGEIEYQLGNIDEAIYNFQSAIDIADEDEVKRKAYLSLSDIYKENRNNSTNALNEQIYILERALGDLQFKDDFVITEYLAEAYFGANRYDESSEKFNKLLSLGYDRPYIYSNLAIIYQQMGNLSQAENILLEMKAKYPNDYKCYVQLAYVYLEQEGMKSEYSRDYSEVLQNYELAKQFSPSGVDNSEVMQLNNKISELRQKGWL